MVSSPLIILFSFDWLTVVVEIILKPDDVATLESMAAALQDAVNGLRPSRAGVTGGLVLLLAFAGILEFGAWEQLL